jgi:hypothetical protein
MPVARLPGTKGGEWRELQPGSRLVSWILGEIVLFCMLVTVTYRKAAELDGSWTIWPATNQWTGGGCDLQKSMLFPADCKETGVAAASSPDAGLRELDKATKYARDLCKKWRAAMSQQPA